MNVVNIKSGDEYTVYIGRAGKGQDGYFGNPIHEGKTCPECGSVHNHRNFQYCYSNALWRRIADDDQFRETLLMLPQDAVLGCFCTPMPCHGEILRDAYRRLKSGKMFARDLGFLSNMHRCKIEYKGQWKCSESLYQACKTPIESERKTLREMDGYKAKQYGRKITMRDGFNKNKIAYMHHILTLKFLQNPDLLNKLKKTPVEMLVFPQFEQF